MTARTDDDEPDRLLDALVQTSFEVIGVVSLVATESDLSLTQLRLLAILRDREPTMSQLATHLGLDRSSISGLIDRAVQRGLVTKTRDDADRRSARVALTPDGQALARRGAAQIHERIAPLLAGLDGTRRQALADLLESLLV